MDSTRRELLKCGAMLGVTPMLGLGAARAAAAAEQAPLPYELDDPGNMIYTVCMNCNTGCSTKVKIVDGAIAKVDGSPYAPTTSSRHVSYATPAKDAARIDGSICPKGQAAIMTVYDPYRIRKVLKRDGARGAMKWKTIGFAEAVREICEGGKLFASVPGEENRVVEGLKDICVLRDAKLADAMGKAVADIWSEKTPEGKKAKVEAFKATFKDSLHLLIDPDHPDLGPKNNQFLWIHGRLKGGRGDFFNRFVTGAMGSVNYHGHTTVCQGSLYFAGKAFSEKYGFDESKKKADWFGGDKFFWQADQSAAEFILFVGVSPFEANYPPLRTPNLTTGVTDARLKYAVVDPRFSKTAAKAWKWLPAKPGSEGALAFGLIRWILENDRHDKRYLANANKAAATADGEPTWSNAPWLVKMKDGKPGEFLRASDLGTPKLKKTGKTAKGEEVEYEFDPFVVWAGGQAVAVDPNDETTAVEGDLLVDTEVNGIKVKSSLQLIQEEAMGRTVEEWAKVCDVPGEDLVALAREFTAHGKKAVADIHRGVSQHTNGWYNCAAFFTLNALVGNYDWRGGFVKAATYDNSGAKAKGPFDFKGGLHPGKAKTFGLGLLREKKWEETTLFDGKYPSRRPWFPNATDVYQELLPSVGDAYPYPVKALLLYMGTPLYANPCGNLSAQVLADTGKLPLFIASDITIGESSMYADYIFPDLSFYERWEFHGSHPNNIWKVQPVRQPAIAPLTETVTVFGEEMPISNEAFMLAVAERLKLPGYGPKGLGDGDFTRPEDFYLRMVANIAFGDKADGTDQVPEASDEELAIFEKARRHLPRSVFDLEKWKAAVGPHWKRVVTVLNRGGRFQEYAKAFDGDKVKNTYGRQVNLYCEKVAKTKNSITGKGNRGYAGYLPVADSKGGAIPFGQEDLLLITYREIFHTKSRTASNPWLMEMMPENHLLIHTRDAAARGLKTDDRVRIVSPSNPDGVWDLPNFGKKPVVAKVRVTEGIRPGVVAFSLGHGHWACGASDVTIDGAVIPGDPRRAGGFHANAVMHADPHLKNVSLQDLLGGSVSFYDSPVRLAKV